MSKKLFLKIKVIWQSNLSKLAPQMERLQQERGRSSSNMRARLRLPAPSCLCTATESKQKSRHHFTVMYRRCEHHEQNNTSSPHERSSSTPFQTCSSAPTCISPAAHPPRRADLPVLETKSLTLLNRSPEDLLRSIHIIFITARAPSIHHRDQTDKYTSKTQSTSVSGLIPPHVRHQRSPRPSATWAQATNSFSAAI